MARKYAFLHFQSGIDYKDVNASLLARLNRLGIRLGKVITVTSGYRTYQEQERLYARYKDSGFNNRYVAAKPGTSNHEHGLAVDAVIDGTPVGSLKYAKDLAAVGLKTLSFDRVHIELSAGGKPTAGQDTAPTPAQAQADQPAAQSQFGSPSQPDVTLPSYQPVAGPPLPEESVAQPAAPGTAGAGINPDPGDSWAQIAALPVADPATGQFAQQVAVALGKA